MDVHKKNYFEYKGQIYGVGTVVKLKYNENDRDKRLAECRGVAEFNESWSNGLLKFQGITRYGVKEGWFSGIWNPEEKIEYIMKPVYAELKPVWQVALNNYSTAKKGDKPDTFIGTLWYIFIMIIGALFYDRWLIWIAATIVFIGYMINKYRDL